MFVEGHVKVRVFEAVAKLLQIKCPFSFRKVPFCVVFQSDGGTSITVQAMPPQNVPMYGIQIVL